MTIRVNRGCAFLYLRQIVCTYETHRHADTRARAHTHKDRARERERERERERQRERERGCSSNPVALKKNDDKHVAVTFRAHTHATAFHKPQNQILMLDLRSGLTDGAR